MLECCQISTLMVHYWDLPSDHPDRLRVDRHIRTCAKCHAQFEQWSESHGLTRQSAYKEKLKSSQSYVADLVMAKIYEEEDWNLAPTRRRFSITRNLRFRLASVVIMFAVIFLFSFVYSVVYGVYQPSVQNSERPSGVIPIASAVGDSAEQGVFFGRVIHGVPVGGVTDPFLLTLDPLQAYPMYFLAFSIIGLMLSLVFLNWLYRKRST